MKETDFAEEKKKILLLKKEKSDLERRSWLLTALVLIFCFSAVIFYMESSCQGLLAEENFRRIDNLTRIAGFLFASTVVLFLFLVFFKAYIWHLKGAIEKFEEILDITSCKSKM